MDEHESEPQSDESDPRSDPPAARSPEADPSGVETFERVLGRSPATGKPLRGVRRMSYDHLFSRVWNRPGLSLRDRTLVTRAVLAAGGHEAQLRAHLGGARSRGLSREEAVEIMVQVAHYAGWPAGMSGQVLVEEVFEDLGQEGRR